MGSHEFPKKTYILMEAAESSLHSTLWGQMEYDAGHYFASAMLPEESLPIIIDVLRGIRDLEKQGIVHGDISEENVGHVWGACSGEVLVQRAGARVVGCSGRRSGGRASGRIVGRSCGRVAGRLGGRAGGRSRRTGGRAGCRAVWRAVGRAQSSDVEVRCPRQYLVRRGRSMRLWFRSHPFRYHKRRSRQSFRFRCAASSPEDARCKDRLAELSASPLRSFMSGSSAGAERLPVNRGCAQRMCRKALSHPP